MGIKICEFFYVLYTLHIYDVEYPPVFRITLTNFH